MKGDRMSNLDEDTLARMYLQLKEIRLLEEQIQYLFLTEAMPGTIHSSIGQEAVAVGVCSCLRKDDYFCGSHRGHGQYIVKGGSAREVMAELFAKETGCCKGMGGSVHLANASVGYFPGVGIVGAQIPIAAGAALSAKLRGTDQVAVAVFGDGATNTGYFHEGLNLASIWTLPVVYVCENNFYGVSMPIEKAMSAKSIAGRASCYSMEGRTVDGNDVLAVYEAAENAVAKARAGGGPTLIECQTYRHKGHSRFEPGTGYRPKEEVEVWLAKDPIPRFRSYLLENQVLSEDELHEIEGRAKAIIDEAVEYSRKSADPAPDVVLNYVFAP